MSADWQNMRPCDFDADAELDLFDPAPYRVAALGDPLGTIPLPLDADDTEGPER